MTPKMAFRGMLLLVILVGGAAGLRLVFQPQEPHEIIENDRELLASIVRYRDETGLFPRTLNDVARRYKDLKGLSSWRLNSSTWGLSRKRGSLQLTVGHRYSWSDRLITYSFQFKELSVRVVPRLYNRYQNRFKTDQPVLVWQSQAWRYKSSFPAMSLTRFKYGRLLRFRACISELDVWLSDRKDMAEVWLRRAQVMYQMGKVPEAWRCLDQCQRAKGPVPDVAKVLQARVNLGLGRTGNVDAFLQSCLDTPPRQGATELMCLAFERLPRESVMPLFWSVWRNQRHWSQDMRWSFLVYVCGTLFTQGRIVECQSVLGVWDQCECWGSVGIILEGLCFLRQKRFTQASRRFRTAQEQRSFSKAIKIFPKFREVKHAADIYAYDAKVELQLPKHSHFSVFNDMESL